MLATHQLSKRHRNRVNQQATCNLTLERPKHVIEDSHVSDTEKSTIVATEVPVSTSEEDKSAAENKTKATAKQRSRKAERDRKKARARLTKKVNPPVSATEEDVPMRDAIDDSNMRLLEIPEQMNNTCSPRDRALDDADSTTPKSGRELEEPDSRPVLSSTPNTTTEHSRRVSRAIRSTIPAIPPYDRKDILDSMDPFGWGAGPGVVEADESENEDVDETSK
ncbi:hypothetical protein BGX31_007175 [Mortierella sp. GBA43]|nr:hypothetical protein BGX31_007175 [Mortierella sp. GBA43]